MKLRIAHVVTLISPEGSYGGPVRVAVNQAKELQSLGHEVVIYATYSGFKRPPSHIDGVKVMLFRAQNIIPRAGFAGTFSGELLHRFARDLHRFDVVHVHLARDFVTMPAVILARLSKTPYVLQTHGMIGISSKLLSIPLDMAITRRALRNASCIFYLTEDELSQLRNVARKEIRLEELHNGVPPAESPVAMTVDSVDVLFLARLQRRKQPALFAEVAASLLTKGSRADFCIVGPDEGEGPQVAKIIADQNSEHLRWEGALAPEMTLSRMRKASIYVLPSINEPFPMSVLEALSVGVPVIVSNSCGLAETIQDAEAGFRYRTGLPPVVGFGD